MEAPWAGNLRTASVSGIHSATASGRERKTPVFLQKSQRVTSLGVAEGTHL